MLKTLSQVVIFSLFFFFLHSQAFSHCEIPCGIYDDKLRITLLQEHIGTIEKSMGKINDLQKGNNQNQLIRWTINKEDHANEFQHIVSQYFLTQRIKPETKKYAEKIAVLHQMLVYAMKCKQTTDLANTEKLRELLSKFDALYFAPQGG